MNSISPSSNARCADDRPCDIYFHLPKTGGITLSNQFFREHRHKAPLETHIGFLTPSAWQHFTQQLALETAKPDFRCSALIGHMKFGAHEMLPIPSRYITFLRDPVKRFASYYYMVRRMGHVPPQHQFDPGRPDWNLPDFETVAAELDNGQTRALANADWDLPFGQCTQEHLEMAKANIDNYFVFVGLVEHFDLSLMALNRICGSRWHFYTPHNVMPHEQKDRLSPDILEAISELNRYDRQLYAYARERFWREVHRYGTGLQLELRAFMACNTVHQAIHRVWYPLKTKLKRSRKAKNPAADNGVLNPKGLKHTPCEKR